MANTLKVNNIERDEFNRPSGVIALNKPEGVTSHDLVDLIRKKLNTRKVGHVGALDVFATGVMIYLVGKSTKLSEKLMHLDKEYKTTILFGIATDTQDPEGKIIEIKTGYSISELNNLQKKVIDFKGKYNQYVSPYSSVKVNGQKLRKLMRKEGFEKQIKYSDDDKKQLILTPNDDTEAKPEIIDIPRKIVEIYDIEILDKGDIPITELDLNGISNLPSKQKFPFIKIRVNTSKGTYIRQLAEDIGSELDMPAMLIELNRTRVGKITLDECLTPDQFKSSL